MKANHISVGKFFIKILSTTAITLFTLSLTSQDSDKDSDIFLEKFRAWEQKVRDTAKV